MGKIEPERQLAAVHHADKLAITHETLSRVLGVRRPDVTFALHVLEGEQLIKATRGLIRILDPERLGAVSRGRYGPGSTMTRLGSDTITSAVSGSAEVPA